MSDLCLEKNYINVPYLFHYLFTYSKSSGDLKPFLITIFD